MKGKIQNLSLDEWFLALQLDKIKHGFHLPFYLKADVSHFVKKYEGKKPPYTALLIKASSILIKENPSYNKVFFKTVLGKKIVYPAYNSVNVPIQINHPEKTIISSISISNAHEKSLVEINTELKAGKTQSLELLPVNRLIHGEGNVLLRKIKLRLILFVVSNFPSFYLKNSAGGISVSSLFAANENNRHYDMQFNAYGITAFTLCSGSVVQEDEKTYLNIGFGFNHITTHGIDSAKALNKLAEILSRSDC